MWDFKLVAGALSVCKVTCGVWHLEPGTDNRWGREKALAETGRWIPCGLSRAKLAEDQGMTGQYTGEPTGGLELTWSPLLEVWEAGSASSVPRQLLSSLSKGQICPQGMKEVSRRGKCLFFSWPKTPQPPG